MGAGELVVRMREAQPTRPLPVAPQVRLAALWERPAVRPALMRGWASAVLRVAPPAALPQRVAQLEAVDRLVARRDRQVAAQALVAA
ncbi:MAG TPA: hypothetical protein VGJ84_19590 [Polyangiaceae bacterium]